MESKGKKNGQITAVYYSEGDGKWHYNKKVLTSKMEIKYESDRAGFDSQEEAMEAYLAYSKIFKDTIQKMTQRETPDTSLLTDMKRWFHNEFIPTRSLSTVTGSSYVLYHFIVPSLGELAGKELDRVTTDDIDRLIKRTDGFCRTSKAQTYKFLNTYFNDAYIEHRISKNIMEGIPSYQMTGRMEAIPVYNPDQIAKFLCNARKTVHFFEIFLAFLGLRTGEIRGIAWQDFSEKSKTLSIRRQLVRKNTVSYSVDGDVTVTAKETEFKTTKSEASSRTIEVPDITFRLLEERKRELQKMRESYESKENRKWNPDFSPFLCLTYQGNIKSTDTMNASLKRICSSARLPAISMHDLRHMAATYLFAYGVDKDNPNDEALERVSHYLGHASVNITFDTYIHSMKDISRIREVLDNAADPFLKFSIGQKGRAL